MSISKQAVHQHRHRTHERSVLVGELIARAQALRRAHPGCGVEKMYYQLKPAGIGRDRFIELMMEQGFRIKRPRPGRRTTHPGTVHYPNLIKGMQVHQPYQLWQSDLTYFEVGQTFHYLVFIIDVYTKKIVGYDSSNNMRVSSNIRALQMALRSHPAPSIHHSDRGSQYSSKQYLALLQNLYTQISMGKEAVENAYAERLNGTIKNEYLKHWRPHDQAHLKRCVQKAVRHYNQQRQHNHLNRMTPLHFENQCLNNPSFQKPVITIFDNNNYLKPVNAI